MDARFVRLRQSRTSALTVWVHYEHVCEAQRGQKEKVGFVWDGIERGAPKACGCTPVVPSALWARRQMVWKACWRLGVKA